MPVKKKNPRKVSRARKKLPKTPELSVITFDYMKSRDGDWKPSNCLDCPHAALAPGKAKNRVCRLTGQPLQGDLPHLMPHCKIENWLKALIGYNQFQVQNDAFLMNRWMYKYIKFVKSIKDFLKELKSTKTDKAWLVSLESAYREWHDE